MAKNGCFWPFMDPFLQLYAPKGIYEDSMFVTIAQCDDN